MSPYRLFLLFIVLSASLIPCPLLAKSKTGPVQNYSRAFKELDANHGDAAMAYARNGSDPVLNKVLRAAFMALPGNNYRFEEMADFVNSNPEWPGLTNILAIAEQKIPTSSSPETVIAWFAAHPPVTLAGVYRYVAALDATGNSDEAYRQIRSRWVENGFSRDDQSEYLTRYGNRLDGEAHWARLDHLLWKNDVEDVRLMYPHVTAEQKAVAEARLALNGRTAQAAALLQRVPSVWRRDEGLMFALLRWYVADKRDDEAVELLINAPQSTEHSGQWWEQRQTIIYRLIEKKDYPLAYRLASENGQTEGKTLLQAEFLAGWLALRMLHDADSAAKHFQQICDSAQTAVSRARGSYWMGRTYEALQDKNRAEQSYEDAAAFGTTYYGQLATTRIFASPTIQVKSEPEIPPAVRAAFNNRDLILAIQRLYALGQIERAHTYFTAAMNAAAQRVDFVLLTELAYKIGRADYAIEAAKAANQKGFLMAASAYPLLKRGLPPTNDPAFVHALIRQESHFNPNAESPVGARGMMQLMPATAKGVAKNLGIKYKPSRLTEVGYNLKLGVSYIQGLLSRYNGSYILALAGYNAGPGRVNEWLADFGDPRNPNVDPIDWIEMLPLSETRNYIQRIMENLQAYRARQNNGQASLLILNDLRR